MSTTATVRTRQRRLSGRARKSVLLVHILSAAAWFGIDLALGICAFTAMLTDDPRTAGTALQALELFAIWPMFIASICCLASGAVLGLGSKYGLVRYWWVVVKLVVNVGMSTLIVTALRSGIGDAASMGERLVAGDPAAIAGTDLLGPVIVAPTLLLTAYVLSVFKPWGRIGRKPRPAPVVAKSRDAVAASPVGVG